MNKIALITGATSGIGQATALKAAEAGFDVIITGRRNDRLQELAESIRQKGADGDCPPDAHHADGGDGGKKLRQCHPGAQ